MNRPDEALSALANSPEVAADARASILAYVAELESVNRGLLRRTQTILQERDDLAAEAFSLSAGVCELLSGNDHGNPYCRGTGKLIEVMTAELAADQRTDPLGRDPRQGRLRLDPEERVLGDVLGPYSPPPPLVRTDCLDAMGGRLAECEGAQQNETDGAEAFRACAHCGSPQGGNCLAKDNICRFDRVADQ